MFIREGKFTSELFAIIFFNLSSRMLIHNFNGYLYIEYYFELKILQ